jgi:hypothetical protein
MAASQSNYWFTEDVEAERALKIFKKFFFKGSFDHH